MDIAFVHEFKLSQKLSLQKLKKIVRRRAKIKNAWFITHHLSTSSLSDDEIIESYQTLHQTLLVTGSKGPILWQKMLGQQDTSKNKSSLHQQC